MITDNARHENVPKAQLYKMPESESKPKFLTKTGIQWNLLFQE